MQKVNFAVGATPVRALGRALSAFTLASALCLPVAAWSQVPFATPEDGATALIDALATGNMAALRRLLGKDWRQLLPQEKLDMDDVYAFLQKASQSRKVDINGNRGELVVGNEPWTLPIPLVKGSDGRWRFDLIGAREVIAERRIGANERFAMKAAQAYVDAQREYATADRNGDGVLEYAQKLLSSPGKRDGLIWNAGLGDESPLGEAYGLSRPGEGYHGYHYKILTGQGPQAPGGARSYLIGKRMTAGLALLAWPAQYGETGVMSFMISNEGTLWESNLGPNTRQIAGSIKLYNPDQAWRRVSP